MLNIMKDNTQDYKDTCAFRDAAIADGWSHKPTYNSEDESRACSLEKDGWKMMIFTRTLSAAATCKYDASISIWAPDGLAVNVPRIYDFQKLKDGETYCKTCGSSNVKTVRYSFAGRCCEKCLPAMRAKHEYKGWCD